MKRLWKIAAGSVLVVLGVVAFAALIHTTNTITFAPEQYVDDPVGHVHDAWQRNGRQINVGVDAWGYGPLHLSTVTDIIREDLDARRILDQ